MNLMNVFTKRQMLKYYINVGSNSSNLNRNNSFFILGINLKISLFNLNKSLFNLKKKISFFIKLFKNKKSASCFIINTNKNRILINKFIKNSFKSKCSYYNGGWWNGLLKNFKRYVKYNSAKKINKFKFFNNQYPSFTFYIDRQKYGEFNKNFIFVNKEINSISMHNIMFFGDYLDVSKNPSIIFSNTKSYLNNLFLFYISLKLVKKGSFINKKKFFARFISKYNNFYIKNLKLFYEVNFCLKVKKNFFKYKLWNGDLN